MSLFFTHQPAHRECFHVLKRYAFRKKTQTEASAYVGHPVIDSDVRFYQRRIAFIKHVTVN